MARQRLANKTTSRAGAPVSTELGMRREVARAKDELRDAREQEPVNRELLKAAQTRYQTACRKLHRYLARTAN